MASDGVWCKLLLGNKAEEKEKAEVTGKHSMLRNTSAHTYTSVFSF